MMACCDLGLSVAVLAQFDFSGSGHIELSELSKLGTAPQSTGQKLSIWTGDKTERVLKKMGKGSDGQVSCEEAAEYLEHALPVDEERFQSVIAEFAADAKAARKRQENRRMREQIRMQKASLSPSVLSSPKPVEDVKKRGEGNNAEEEPKAAEWEGRRKLEELHGRKALVEETKRAATGQWTTTGEEVKGDVVKEEARRSPSKSPQERASSSESNRDTMDEGKHVVRAKQMAEERKEKEQQQKEKERVETSANDAKKKVEQLEARKAYRKAAAEEEGRIAMEQAKAEMDAKQEARRSRSRSPGQRQPPSAGGVVDEKHVARAKQMAEEKRKEKEQEQKATESGRGTPRKVSQESEGDRKRARRLEELIKGEGLHAWRGGHDDCDVVCV